MGGGSRNIRETPKRLPLPTRETDLGEAAAGNENAPNRDEGSATDLGLPICEREQAVSFRTEDAALRVGERVRVALATPPVLVVGDRQVGRLTDRRQASTLTACLEDGYRLSGEVVAVDRELGEGFAIIIGFRSG